MFERRIPEWIRHAPAPSVRGFATLAGFEAITRGILISVFPVALYDALQDATLVSSTYFGIGIFSLIVGFLVPFLNRFAPRRVIYSLGVLAYVVGSGCAIFGPPERIVLALVLHSIATVTAFVCFNAYVLDYIARIELGKCETLRMFYSAMGWTVGPMLGVILWTWWKPAPFLVSSIAAMALLAAFLFMRLGNGKLITRARKPAPNPLAFLGRFLVQPRLVAGWLFAVIRSCGWWACRSSHLKVAWANVSGAIRQMRGCSCRLAAMDASALGPSSRGRGFSRRTSVWRGGFSGKYPMDDACLFAGSFFLILLDICAGLPFLMAVKPSERTEMSAIYSSFRDVSGVLTPGAAWLVLLVFPINGIFAAAGGACFLAWHIARRTLAWASADCGPPERSFIHCDTNGPSSSGPSTQGS